jgi:hypothetical protein
MNAREALKISIDMGEYVGLGYLQDLSDAELMHRPAPKANHIKWQLGHLIVSENNLINQVFPGAMPPLPAGFAEKYKKERAASDNPAQFHSKADLLAIYSQQREATLAALEKCSDSDFDKPSGVEYAPTVGAIFALQGSHWLMHAGQWAVIRRQLGRPPMY